MTVPSDDNAGRSSEPSRMTGRRFPFFWRKQAPVVPVVPLSGVIAARGGLGQRLSLESVSKQLTRAFAMKSAPVVALLINSPGGSPVQANLIYQRVRALSAEKKKPVIAFVEDVAASGGYVLALAGDEIIVDQNSIVGSIGVVSAGFGFTGLMEKIGVERRLYTSGKSKAMLDPFMPEKKADIDHLKALQGEIHQWFIALVKDRRPGLSKDTDLFTGAFWTGGTALNYGLVDRIGDLRSVLKERYGSETKLLMLSEKRGLLRRWMGGSANTALASRSAGAIITAIEEHAEWKRFGL